MVSRRQLLEGSIAIGTAAFARRPADAQNDKVVLAMVGVNGRGTDLASGFAGAGAEIAYVCDPDERAIGKCARALEGKQARSPMGIADFRRALDDKSVDAVVVATPDHWHGPATILACSAGKHVYVEKPACHNPHEGELMIAAARKHNRVVQVGTQRRSMAGVIEAVERLKSGELGRVLFARGWYNNTRPTIGTGKTAPVPSWLDYSLWQGPAPETPYRDNVIHYNWHWFWRWGTGELGNNGIHALDVCRWGLGVDYPRRVTANGGKYFYHDDQETPDTHVVTYDFGDKAITWEGRNWHARGFEGSMFGMAFYGEKGLLISDGGGYTILGMDGKEISKGKGPESQQAHLKNFLECIRSGKRPNADIEEGHKSTLLCHLGNIAYRTGRTLNINPRDGHILADKEAMDLWSREYRKGWEPRI